MYFYYYLKILIIKKMEQTALHWAAIKGHEKIAHLLLEKGAYVDHIDKSNRTPLYYAIRNSNYSIANVNYEEYINFNIYFLVAFILSSFSLVF